jgi:energy-coupling factor transport system ATP-binding protein
MVGAFIAGFFYRYSRNIYIAALGEIIGTGLLGAIASALIVAPVLMRKGMAMGALIVTFSGSSLLGSIIGVLALKLLERAGIAKLKRNHDSPL